MENKNERYSSGLTSEQLKKFGQVCVKCQQPYGAHQAGTFNCPKLPRDSKQPFLTDCRFAEPNPEIVAADAAGEVLDVTTAPLALFPQHPKLKKLATFNIGRGARNGQCVEVVAAGALPTTKGLRHIADKRRVPKARDHES